ncbi:MAG: TetR/AcrR family transcriptional regulator [Pseudomonadota bacterium]
MLCQDMRHSTVTHSTENLDWKEPSQARSRAKVALILDTARDMAAEAGHLDIKMTEVAARANVPIGSVYQYFPTRTTLLARLFAREMEPIDRALTESLSNANSLDDIVQGIGDLMRSNIEIVRANPGLFAIWSSPTMDPILQAADLENSQKNARAITEAVLSFGQKRADEEAVGNLALLICHLWGSVVRLSILMQDNQQADDIVEQYVGMIEGQIRRLTLS